MRISQLFVIIFAITLSGCATNKSLPVLEEAVTCVESVRSQQPLASAVESKYGLGSTPLTFEQRLNETQLTDEEKLALIPLWANLDSACNAPTLSRLKEADPAVAKVVSISTNLIDDVRVLLLNDEITAQQASHFIHRDIIPAMQSDLAALDKIREDENSAKRAAFLTGLARGRERSAEQAKSIQQPMTHTHCSKIMNQVNCTTF